MDGASFQQPIVEKPHKVSSTGQELQYTIRGGQSAPSTKTLGLRCPKLLRDPEDKSSRKVAVEVLKRYYEDGLEHIQVGSIRHILRLRIKQRRSFELAATSVPPPVKTTEGKHINGDKIAVTEAGSIMVTVVHISHRRRILR